MKYVSIGAFPNFVEMKPLESAEAKVIYTTGSRESAEWVVRRLKAIGYHVDNPIEVEESSPAIEEAVRIYLGVCDLLIIVSRIEPGSAPVFEAVSSALGRPLIENENARRLVEEYYYLHGMEETSNKGVFNVPEEAKTLIMLPEGAIVFSNPKGPAPAVLLEEEGKYVLCVPGTLSEVAEILEDEADSYLRGLLGMNLSVTVHIMTKTWDETVLEGVIEEVSEAAPWLFAQLKKTVFSREGWGVTVTVFSRSHDELYEKFAKGVKIVEESLERRGVEYTRKNTEVL